MEQKRLILKRITISDLNSDALDSIVGGHDTDCVKTNISACRQGPSAGKNCDPNWTIDYSCAPTAGN
jgi:hypothetical protein